PGHVARRGRSHPLPEPRAAGALDAGGPRLVTRLDDRRRRPRGHSARPRRAHLSPRRDRPRGLARRRVGRYRAGPGPAGPVEAAREQQVSTDLGAVQPGGDAMALERTVDLQAVRRRTRAAQDDLALGRRPWSESQLLRAGVPGADVAYAGVAHQLDADLSAAVEGDAPPEGRIADQQ